jgi:hypothetical protein
MFVLGLLVLAAAGVAAVELILANRGPIDFHMWSWTWHFDAFWLAVIGAIIVTAAWIGLGLLQIAFGHARRIRREHRALAAENRVLAERAGSTEAAETVQPMPPERRVAAGEPTRSGYAASSDAGYTTPVGRAEPGTGYASETDGTTPEGERHGFFSRHAMSGRGHRR